LFRPVWVTLRYILLFNFSKAISEMLNVKLLLLVAVAVAVLFMLYFIVNGKSVKVDSFTGVGEAINTFTLYYMNGCPHCETILPDFKNFVATGQYEAGGKKTTIRMLEQANPSAAADLKKYNIRGFPTFILEKPDGSFMTYDGDRTVPAMQEFIAQNAA
jgi:thiol-disulfide isomerase/thioredoxin